MLPRFVTIAKKGQQAVQTRAATSTGQSNKTAAIHGPNHGFRMGYNTRRPSSQAYLPQFKPALTHAKDECTRRLIIKHVALIPSASLLAISRAV
jgi:hypothetical protein